MSITLKKVLAIALTLAMLVSAMVVLSSCSSCNENNIEDPMEYTYNTYLSEFPDVWNNHTYETATDAEIIGYTEPGFFTFDYNEAKDGYKIVPDMATKEPEDVTAQYAEKYGFAADANSLAWKITIRDDIKWEDGTPIKAQDFVESVKLLLNPVADNHRADNVYAGNLVLVGAKNYFKQGETELVDNGATGDFAVTDLVKAEDGSYKTAGGDPVYIATGMGIDWLSGNTLADYVGEYGATYFDADAFTALNAKADDKGLVVLNDENLALLVKVITAVAAWGETEADAANYLVYDHTYPEASFDSVGIEAVSDTEIVIALEKPLKGFYLLYNLTGNLNLVNIKLYNECMEIKDNVYNNTYGTSAETYISYGPYKLTEFQADKSIILEKNDQWYGYNDEENKGLYQTTKIVYDCITDPKTAMLAFLQGKLDAKGLDADTIADYSMSEHVYYTDGASTFFIAINPDMAALEAGQKNAGENINKTILTIKEFRMALSFTLDRKAFNLAADPTGSVGLAVYNNLIISDPENGIAYRTTDQAKKVLAEFWGVADDIGEGKMYATIDDAIAAITGYNLEEGKKLFDQAYDKAIEAGLMDADDVVEIMIGTPNLTSAFYNKGYDYLVNCYTDAVKGTKLEGKLTFKRDGTLGNGFSAALQSNQVNMLFGVGWQGSALDPFGLMTAYTHPNYQYDPAWNTAEEQLEITLKDGVKYTASVLDWTMAIDGTEINITPVDGDKGSSIVYSCGSDKEDPEERLEILAAIEGAVLRNYDLLPINNESSAALKGMQISYYTEEYVYGVGRGGIKYMTYNYTDMAWANYVAEQGGELNYK